MNRDIVPSFYGSTRSAGELDDFDDHFGNNLLRVGEVKRIVYPEDKNSRTKKFIEYDVLVAHRANGTAVTKLYQSCLHVNDACGFADYNFQLLRVDAPEPGVATDEDSRFVEKGFGSKVLILCINGASSEPVILGGIRDDAQSDLGRKEQGVHKDWEYNGVHVHIGDDGGFSVEYKGPTTPRGVLDTARGKDEQVGTKVEVKADGSFLVSTKGSKQSIVIDHANGAITALGDKDLTVDAETIHLGVDADEHCVLGDTLVDMLGKLIDLITVTTHPTPVGPSGPPLNVPAYKALKVQLATILSEFVFIKKRHGSAPPAEPESVPAMPNEERLILVDLGNASVSGPRPTLGSRSNRIEEPWMEEVLQQEFQRMGQLLQAQPRLTK